MEHGEPRQSGHQGNRHCRKHQPATLGETTGEPFGELHLSACTGYDRTGRKTYKQQIAYTPRVSGSGQAGIETPWVNLSYSFLFSGKRYMLGQNLRENRLDSYSDHSVSVSRDLRIRNVNTSLTVEVLNLLDKNYEIVKNFPMPGRSVRVTMKVRY